MILEVGRVHEKPMGQTDCRVVVCRFDPVVSRPAPARQTRDPLRRRSRGAVRMNRFLSLASMIVPIVTAVSSLRGASYYPLRLDDPKAVYLTTNNFPVHADGLGDDADALQQ